MNTKSIFTLLIAFSCLAGCGGESNKNQTANEGGSDPVIPEICQRSVSNIQWDRLLTENRNKLSDYQLFSSQCNPTASPNERGIPYDLSVPLFTDYASKYRFLFLPDNSAATYHDNEAFEFPLGTVISKTFSMPANTNQRGFEHETLLETRLLIKRENGWVTLPYIWNESKTDAELGLIGGRVSTSLTHENELTHFQYAIPGIQQCSRCHQIKPDGDADQAFLAPIGPKARYLNSDYDYGNGLENQLEYWSAQGLLTGLPDDKSTIAATPSFKPDTAIESIPPSQLTHYAKAWLDVNCAHCHRAEGGASNTAFQVDYNMPFDTHKIDHGVCGKPVSYGGSHLSWLITPGTADTSIIVQRMVAIPDGSGDQMPPLGRELVHREGLALIKTWINSMPAEACDGP